MYVCKVIGKIISTVKNEKLVGHSIVLVQAAALNDRAAWRQTARCLPQRTPSAAARATSFW